MGKILDIDDLYTPGAEAHSSETKSLAFIIFNAIRTKQLELHTSFPAEVVEVSVPGSFVTIRPLLKRRFMDGSVVELPNLADVPICFPRGAGYSIRFPVKPGDTGLAVCSERSLDVWKVMGGAVDPNDQRLHALSDAVFFPGLYPKSDPVPVEGGDDSLTIINEQAMVAMQPTGKFMLKSGVTGDELVDLISQFANLMANTTVNTLLGPQPLMNAAQVAALKVKIDALKGA